mgnify:FL=1|jgi:hypothetical protein
MAPQNISITLTQDDIIAALEEFKQALPVPVLPGDVIDIDPSKPQVEVREAIERLGWQQMLYGNAYFRILTPPHDELVILPESYRHVTAILHEAGPDQGPNIVQMVDRGESDGA